jgi:membrane fusion protein (multidrug efflux system)
MIFPLSLGWREPSKSVVDARPRSPPAAAFSFLRGDAKVSEAKIQTEPEPRRSFARRARWPLMIAGPALVLIGLGWVLVTGGRFQGTDDAYVEAARVAVSPSVAGRVIELDVHENEKVKRGQILFKLDPRDYQSAVEQGQAALAGARLQVQSLKAAYAQQLANLKAAQDTVAFAEREAAREQTLANGGVASRQQLDQARHAADQAHEQDAAARQQVAAALANLGGQPDHPVDQHPAVLQALAALDKARLNLSYTIVSAPSDGTVAKVDQLQVGAYVNAAQPLFWLVSGAPWVDANFKESQLARMRLGQPATIRIDAYPGQTFTARLASFSPGTGESFSVLPPQNATGNWVKVVQRLTVRLTFDQPPPDMASHAGLSAYVKVDTRAPRSAKP